MLATYIISLLLISYSGWIIYKHIRNKIKGKCDEVCSGCALNGFCPSQLEKPAVTPLILDKQLVKQKD